MKKNNYKWMMLVALMGLALTGCSDEYMREITDNEESQKEEEDKTTSNAEKVKEMLEQIPRISDVTIEFPRGEKDTVFVCKFEQLIDHKNPGSGTFKQRLAIRYVDADAPVVFHTQGYALTCEKQDLTAYLQANYLEVEHRYFKESLPEPLDEDHLDMQYLYTDQAAADLHEVAQVMKANLFKNGKWVSTGASKGGITTALFAYYSNLNGWNDIDLYIPFCAPFLSAAPTDSADPRIGQYLINKCGAGYPKGSDEAVAYENLRKIPAAITANEKLRKACVTRLHVADPKSYLEMLKKYGKSELDATCCVLYAYYSSLYDRFAYLDYSEWAPLVPDPDDITEAEDEDKMNKAIEEVVTFIFASLDEFKLMVFRHLLGGNTYTNNDDSSSNPLAAVYNDEQLIYAFASEATNVYYVQALRELGTTAYDYSLVDQSYVKPEYVKKIVDIFETGTVYNRYVNQWDGGKLMNNLRQWVYTESSAPIVFVYAANDPWTGGQIDDEAAKQNPKVRKVVTAGGHHSDSFLHKSHFTEESSNEIKAAIKDYIGL